MMRAAVSRLAAALLLTLICAAVAAVCLVWMFAALAAGSARGWRLAIGFDQLGNAAAGGDEDEVFSSRCWRLRDRAPYRWLRPMIDAAFALLGDADHCRSSWEGEQKKRVVRT
jgi:hypothetical protein